MQTTDLEPGESVRVTATEDAFYGMVGDFESREADGRCRVRFMKHGGISIAFARYEIERATNPEVPKVAIATSLQPDPTANPPITEAEANMARKSDEGHQRDMAAIAESLPHWPAKTDDGQGLNMPMFIGLEHVRESSLSAIVGKEQLAARARDLFYTPGEPGTARRAALAEMAAKDPQVAEDVAMVAALVGDPTAILPADEGEACAICEPTDVYVGPLPAPGPFVIVQGDGALRPNIDALVVNKHDADEPTGSQAKGDQ